MSNYLTTKITGMVITEAVIMHALRLKWKECSVSCVLFTNTKQITFSQRCGKKKYKVSTMSTNCHNQLGGEL